ncbi:MAG TPA: type II CAAX endopeptidase family protein [Rubrobacteraceae bacterium]|nr:type II CAAX endopeptidase family protein [Rubrobacteraceae bacterium]
MSSAIAGSSGGTRRQARRGLTIYFAVVVMLSASIESFIIKRPDIDGPFIVGLMFVPAIASIVARLVLKEGFSDVSFRFGGRHTWRAIGLALIFPTVVGLTAYGIAWTTGLVRFSSDGSSPIVVLLIGIILATTLWTALSSLVTAGEEIGWRGYMLTRLIDSKVSRPVLVSGLIWGLWHVPLVLAEVYAAGPSPALSAAFIMVSIISFGYVIARLRLETGSIWPAIILHSSWNSIIQGPFDGATTGAGAAVWVGESGILTALTLVVVAVVFSRGRWAILRQPPNPSVAVSLPTSTITG